MSNAMRIFYVKTSGLVVAYGTMDWEDGADWDPAIHAFISAPGLADLPSSEPITLGPGPAPQYNWRYDSDTGKVVDA